MNTDHTDQKAHGKNRKKEKADFFNLFFLFLCASFDLFAWRIKCEQLLLIALLDPLASSDYLILRQIVASICLRTWITIRFSSSREFMR